MKTANLAKANFSPWWLIYLIFTIGFFGSVILVGIATPIYIIGRVVPLFRRTGAWIMENSVKFLLMIQPWLEYRADMPLPSGGALLVSNHRSHLDVFLLLANVRGVRVLSKSDLYKILPLGLLMWASEQIPVRRGDISSFSTAMDRVRMQLRRGDNVHIFPEMTRREPGQARVGNFMLAPFAAAIQEDKPVVPVVVGYTDQIWPKGIFGIRTGRVSVRALKPLYPQDFRSVEDLKNAAHHAIEMEFEKVTPGTLT